MRGAEIRTQQVQIEAGATRLPGTLSVPEGADGIVLFVHGTGSSRLSPRNRLVASELESAGIGALLFDLLTEPESYDRSLTFDIDLLSRRLAYAVDFVERKRETLDLARGLFGASTGAAAALVVAAEHPRKIDAVVSRGGRPDLAGDRLPLVQAPTLLVVGGHDPEVQKLNQQSFERLNCTKEIVTIPGATHLFEEPGALELVGSHAVRWFGQHLRVDRGEPETQRITEDE